MNIKKTKTLTLALQTARYNIQSSERGTSNAAPNEIFRCYNAPLKENYRVPTHFVTLFLVSVMLR